MKTQNNTQETVNEQVKRMILRGSAVIVGLALISLAVNAQDLWNQLSNNNYYGKTALMMNSQASETKKTDAVFEAIDAEIAIKLNHAAATFAFEAEHENTLQLEAWMTDEALFTSNLDFNAVETEEELTIENWMTDAKNFMITMISESVELEKPLEIEPWMAVEEYFNSVETLTNTESALKIENWMLNSHNFNTQNEPMQLEAWMTDSRYWASN
ncbi:MAG: hypothetical protein Q8R96_19125 [Bacteroidota bacterium]|nr:hypothetical protein [Bacteroidota bacterium]